MSDKNVENVSSRSGPPLLLVVEDEPIYLEALVDTLRESGYDVLTAETGEAAWQIIETYRGNLDAILLDRLLPDMDSLVLLPRLQESHDYDHLPVIIQTGLSSTEDIAAGLQAGAYYYLTKPFQPKPLLAIVQSAVRDRRGYRSLQHDLEEAQNILRLLDHGEFSFRTQQEARGLAQFLAHAAADPRRVVLGLTELMLNAVEHGNLGITYAEKTLLLAEDMLAAEVERRFSLPEYASRRARVRVTRADDVLEYVIRDEGKGFDWQRYIDMSPERAFDTHGRGIAMSRIISFDKLEYVGSGNEVHCQLYSLTDPAKET